METGIHELTAAYALDALDPEERRDFEAHLRDCERCRDELASFSSVTEALAVGASGPSPAPELRERLLAAARAEPQVVVPFERPARRVLPVVATGLAAVAAVAALAVGLWAVKLSGDLDDARSALEQQREVASVLADPEAETVGLAAGEGRLVVDSDGRAVLVVDGLGQAPAGKTYEIWIIEGESAPVPAGLFPGREETDHVFVEEAVDEGAVVAVTVEDAGGVDAPSTEPVVASQPV
jgi:anti-sigma-K factor RskA